ncbi:acylphosphatase [Mongoliitalea daihaiensis]|uniref:acylphosphatase n=1 Tax=Mongoliitalea daihaiensis TaxID=2782006 RepID=UPI001F162E9A|nr:acylphosphatase [Mongoliitalea daihaiensis]
MINRRIQVYGKVQGVFFRKSTYEKALDLRIKGWVKNEADGSVSVEIEGELHGILAMSSWLKSGPPLSKVTNIKIEEQEEQGYEDFKIL